MKLALLGLIFACSTSRPENTIGPDAESPDTPVDRDAGSHLRDAVTLDATAADAAAPADASLPDVMPKPVTRVLFIGNSYTEVNNLPEVLSALGKSNRSPVFFSVARHTPGGTSWEIHDNNPAVTELIQQGWDTVVLQDQSVQPWRVRGIKPALISLDGKIKSAGAETVLFMTWARVYGPNFSPPHYAMEMAVNHYYERHAAAVDARVAPVGRAWERALRDPLQTLHTDDGSHPNPRGTYLAACVFYATLTEQSPVGLGSGGLGLSEAERAVLQNVAWDTHLSRQRLSTPEVGSWPLAPNLASQDWIPSRALTPGDAVGPDGPLTMGTQFGLGKHAAIPYFPGLNTPELTAVVHAYREDWSVRTTDPEALLAKSWAYELQHNQLSLEATLYTTNSTDAGAFIRYPVNGLSAGWHQFAVTYDGTTYTLWVDAQPVGSDRNQGEVRYYGLSPDEIARYNAVAIGAHIVDTALSGASPGPWFTGALSNIQIFDRALSQTELQNL